MFKKKEKLKTLPNHIAFIMDGNRRWAVRRGLNKMLGHKQGAIVMKNMVLALSKIEGIKYASFFAFSTENWNREKGEIDYLFNLVKDFLTEQDPRLSNANVKVKVVGLRSGLSKEMLDAIDEVENRTKNNTGLVVNLAFNYGGRDDIVQAANKVAESGEKITAQNLQENLFCPQDIDLLVRTSGELRISNFMLFQMAYSELYFTDTLWPDFDDKQLAKALDEFSKRNRRFGGK